jgi:hypothetical protein
MLGAMMLLTGGTVLSCANTLANINLCGTVFTFCTPTDQLNLLYPYLDTPDYTTDPSCTIPLGCGSGDVLPPLEGGPGGDAPEQPQNGQGGGLGGGGGGGGV